MALKAVIFDLDLTLIASAVAEPLRKQRQWPAVYRLIPQLTPYDGVPALLELLGNNGVKTSIVTSSPGTYCGKILLHWKLPVMTTVCYHDTAQRKPHPAPMLKALEKMQVAPEDTIAVGDMPADIESAKAANIFAVAAIWGATGSDQLIQAKPNLVCATVEELTAYIKTRLSL